MALQKTGAETVSQTLVASGGNVPLLFDCYIIEKYEDKPA
jgi:hypothetical protein